MKILSLSGLVPEQICDTVRFTGYKGDISVSHYCGYVSDFISQVLSDETVDGAVFPRSCDSCRVIKSYLEGCGKFIYQLHVPARHDSMAIDYFAACLRQYKRDVEREYGIDIRDIPERVMFVNQRNKEIAKVYERLLDLSYSAYLRMVHELLRKPLFEQKVAVELPAAADRNGPPVYLVGSMQTGEGLAEIVEAAGLNIAGDRLTESKRLFRGEVSVRGDIFRNISEKVLCQRTSPTQNDFDNILNEDRRELSDKNIKGVIYITQKFCEPYDFLFPTYKHMLDELEIPVIRINTDDMTDNKKCKMMIETFAEMIR